jgi:23S rRNA (cytosine1962-C5)-methyltransferase
MSGRTSIDASAGLEKRDLLTAGWEDYELLDSGEEARLERFGSIVLIRPAQQAIWKRRRPRSVWDQAHANFTRDASGKGTWTERRPMPEAWPLRFGPTLFTLRCTSFGHIGFFAEQRPCWDLMRGALAGAAEPPSVLNLFAYSGSMTLAAAQAGARVCHVDASPPVVEWARKNAAQSGLGDAPIRWIVEDAAKFVRREVRRGSRYEGLILDPPSFGRGPKGEVFKLEPDLQPLLEECLKLLSERARFVLLSCHTPGITGAGLANLLTGLCGERGGRVLCGELLLVGEEGSSMLPSGSYGCWMA